MADRLDSIVGRFQLAETDRPSPVAQLGTSPDRNVLPRRRADDWRVRTA
jgi:hypothetical protein